MYFLISYFIKFGRGCMLKNTKKNNKGYALLGVLAFIAIFAILSTALLAFLKYEVNMYQNTEANIRAEYLALGGVQVYQKLKGSINDSIVLYPIKDDTRSKIKIELTEEPNVVKVIGIIDEGSSNESKFTITIEDDMIKRN